MVRPKVSVIIPSLNTAAYLRECMDSVLAQTLSELEIWFIDAGSTDGTLTIIEEYMGRDERIRLLHSDKKSYGYQVNLGIAQAKGEYVAIVEPDDYLERDAYEKLYQVAKQTMADYVKGTADFFFRLTENTDYRIPYLMFSEAEYARQNGMIATSPKRDASIILKDTFLWNGLYRASLIRQIQLNETKGAAYQDIGFLMQLFCLSEKAIFIRDKVYHYRNGDGNASAYHRNAFAFLKQEYMFIELLYADLTPEAKESVEIKLFYQTHKRFVLMTLTGHFWDKAEEPIQYIQKRISSAVKKGIVHSEHVEQGKREDFLAFLESPLCLYNHLQSKYAPYQTNLRTIRQTIGDGDAIIFGCGNWGSFLVLLLLKWQLKGTVVFCDNDPARQGTYVKDVPVLSPEQARERFPDAAVIIANKRHREDIKSQLLDSGVAANRIGIYEYNGDPIFLHGIL